MIATVLFLACATLCDAFAPLPRATPASRCPRTSTPILKWAGQSRANKLFSADNIPSGMSPQVFYAGVGILLVSNFGVAAVVALDRIAPGSAPPINAFTDIANVAMERAVAAGDVPKPLATFWAQSMWLDMLREYMAAGEPASQFVANWCEAAPERFEWCTAAKELSAVGPEIVK